MRNKISIIMNIIPMIIFAITILISCWSCGNLEAEIKTQEKEKAVLNNKIANLNNNIIEKDKIIKEKEEKIKEYKATIDILEEQNKKYEENKEEETKTPNQNLSSGANLSKKTYMDYRCISKNSAQGNIVYSKDAWTDENGLRRYGEYYCVAMGSYYGSVGDVLEISTDKGNVYKVILGDIKADKHTDGENKYTVHNGCMLEFIVDEDKLSDGVRTMGSVDGVGCVSGEIVGVK